MNKYTDSIIECPNGFSPALQELISLNLQKYVKFDDNDNPIGLNNINRFYPAVPTFDSPAILYIRAYNEIINELLYNEGNERIYQNIKILVVHPAEGIKIIIGQDSEGNDIYRTKDIYESLKENEISLNIYNSYIYHPAEIDDNTGYFIDNQEEQQLVIITEFDEEIGDFVEIQILDPNYQSKIWVSNNTMIPNPKLQKTVMVPSGEYVETTKIDIGGNEYIERQDILIEVDNYKYDPFKKMGVFA